MASPREVLTIAGREVAISNPTKVFFPALGLTKLDLVRYYLVVADGAVRGVAGRPLVLKRFPDGVDAEPFYQKRAPTHRPPWIETAVFTFPSGRTAEEVVVRDAAALAWVVNLGCVDLNPQPVRAGDLDHPDELRIDLDPVPGVGWPQIVEVAQLARAVLADHGLVGWPKTSGSRGVHVLVRIRPAWSFTEVRRAALAVAREVERRAPTLATSKWWKEERHGVFLDYNQNARDRTTASAYSVRPTADARVSMPLTWDALATCDPAAFTIATVPALVAAHGDAHAAIDDVAGELDGLLALAGQQAAAGLGDAPWPPHFEKASGEAPRVAPSRAKTPGRARRTPKLPLVLIGQAKRKDDALAGLARWQARHPAVAARLAPEDVLVDTMRGRSSAYYRVRINLQRVPEAERPAEVAPDPDYDPAVEWAGARRR
ncbi:MAG: non-homologous end-joining DNA ligase [Myxococcales bacterium]|nr:non-homologous end-joining DNA ligase [Myxococcales bacterium]MBP6849459.1 non-homologous end-joining DNA ligase [Kofleriaceae bacterium]